MVDASAAGRGESIGAAGVRGVSAGLTGKSRTRVAAIARSPPFLEVSLGEGQNELSDSRRFGVRPLSFTAA